MILIDWIIIIAFFIVYLSIGYYFRKKATSTKNFFLGGQNLPWYIAGTSMVATTFAADTPLAVTELVAQNGIAGNWLWWNMVFGGMLTVFFFAKLWRRAGILTDCEFATIRYSGKAAHFLRGFRAIYIGILMNTIVIAWVNLAMVKILRVIFPDLTFFGLHQVNILGFTFSAHLLWVGMLMFFIGIYTTLSGLIGNALTDSIQFIIAMTGCIILAIVTINHQQIGGIKGITSKLPEWMFSFYPQIGNNDQNHVSGILQLSLISFVTYLGVQWWASWYPGAEPGGGGYIAQRLMSAKNEKHSVFSMMWFQIAHFTLRPWPWILVALASIILYPDLPPEQKGDGFVLIIKNLLPNGLLGLLIAAFFAAYMSTIASQCLWGTSYIVNDLFKPYIRPNKSERYYVLISRITIFLLIIFSLFLTSKLHRISDAWKFILECSAGIGPVLLLRWYWWRINAWSEISALVAPFIIYPFILHFNITFPYSLLLILIWSSIVWLCVTYLTKPTHSETLQSFYNKVQPMSYGWKPFAKNSNTNNSDMKYLLLCWFLGSLTIITVLFATGKFIFGKYLEGIIYTSVSILAGYLVYLFLSKTSWNKESN